MRWPTLPAVVSALLPRTLRARLIALVLGTLLLAQAATLATVTHYQRHYLDAVAIDLIATTIRALRFSVNIVPPHARDEFVRDASQGHWRLWSRTLPSDARVQGRGMRGRPPPSWDPDPADIRRNLRGLVERLNAHLGEGTRVALSRGPRPQLFISLSANTQDDTPGLHEWLVVPLDRIDPPVGTPLLVFWLGGLGLLLLLAAWFSWHISRPITHLAQAADELARGHPSRVTPSGPHETRVLGERFNAMLDALAESDRVRRTLLAGLPHDLKGPLARMFLRVEMAEDPALKEGLRKDLSDMQGMVDQFIGFVRGTDPGTYRFTEWPLNEWLAERVTAWQSSGAPVSLTRNCDTPLRVQGDAAALERLLDNLIGNALHHGAPPVQVSLQHEDGSAVLRVCDHGQGIAPERREDALRPFSRLDDARTRSGNVGLGLALADAIARAHGGSLALETAASGGLQVTVRLPACAES
ncbi:HAMP domain-containing sensor histidine kinase [Orrella sp. JC864]|uniref:HAMP domain-containing sensor histidine kinase n=1 Tax=Orrella sp. JC864 TaxID=3120298 RepID=UPI0012BC4ACE